MNWRLVALPEVEEDILQAAEWYELQLLGLGGQFVIEIELVLEMIAQDPLLLSRKHPSRNIRWRYPERFPYRIIYEVIEEAKTVHIIAVLHAARQEETWRARL